VAFSDDDVAELEEGLARFAEFLYGSAIFRHLYSLGADQLRGRRATFAWLFLTDTEAAHGFEYRPQSCSFEPIDDVDDILTRYVGVVTSWAVDVLSIMRGTIEPRMVTRQTRQTWFIDGVDLAPTLWLYFHPLRHPERCLKQYRSLVRAESKTEPVVRRAR
jgi:hypothetical protein